MIESFADKLTEDVFNGVSSKEARKLDHSLHNVARRKLDIINGAVELVDLKVPPGNRLEALKGSKKGLFSIRINEKWRITFAWENGKAKKVKIEDYHG